MMVGWITAQIQLLTSANTPLSSILTNDELSWLVAISCIGSVAGSLINGYVVSLVGSKRALLSLTIPAILFWLLIHFGTTFSFIFCAKVIDGYLISGTFVTLNAYISEIANDNIRGRLTSIGSLSVNLGILIAYILGATVNYHYIPYICVPVPIIFVIIFTTLPNTPRYHIRKGDIQSAKDALKFYKGCKGKEDSREDVAIKLELDRLRMVESEQNTAESLKCADFCNRSAIKGLFIGIALNTIIHFTAYFTLTNYATMIFAHTDSTLFSPHMASIMLGIAFTVGSLFPTYLADILGRKLLLIISLIGCVLGLSAMATHNYLQISGHNLASFKWIPVLSLSLSIFFASAGVVPISIVCCLENLPPKIRNVGMTIIGCGRYLISFGFLKVFPLLLQIIELYGCMIMFAILSFVGIVFVATVLKETTGTCLDDVGVDEKTKNKRKCITNSPDC